MGLSEENVHLDMRTKGRTRGPPLPLRLEEKELVIKEVGARRISLLETRGGENSRKGNIKVVHAVERLKRWVW